MRLMACVDYLEPVNLVPLTTVVCSYYRYNRIKERVGIHPFPNTKDPF